MPKDSASKKDTEAGVKASPKREWVKIGISGFDQLFEKGIPKGTNILIAGGPGTGKTIFCLQSLYNAARDGNDCLYITMEESPERLRMHMEGFGWEIKPSKRGDENFQTLEAGGKGGTIFMRKLDPIRTARYVEALLAKASGELSIDIKDMARELIPPKISPYLVTIDSISALESAFTGRTEGYRIYVEMLFRLLEDTGSTSLLITETEEAPVKFSRSGVEEFLADGVFVFYNMKVRDIRVRALEVLKMRGAKHERKIVPTDITPKGMVVFPKDRVYMEKKE